MTAGDPLAENDTLERGVWADPKSKVLYVEGVPSSARYLSGALQESGFDVAVRPPAGIPSTDTGLNPFDVVVLSDVARDAIGAPAMASLGQWVERAGGGLLVAGGAAVFGERGYRQTEIERLAPVTFERRDEPSLALVLVLDRSWSMMPSVHAHPNRRASCKERFRRLRCCSRTNPSSISWTRGLPEHLDHSRE